MNTVWTMLGGLGADDSIVGRASLVRNARGSQVRTKALKAAVKLPKIVKPAGLPPFKQWVAAHTTALKSLGIPPAKAYLVFVSDNGFGAGKGAAAGSQSEWAQASHTVFSAQYPQPQFSAESQNRFIINNGNQQRVATDWEIRNNPAMMESYLEATDWMAKTFDAFHAAGGLSATSPEMRDLINTLKANNLWTLFATGSEYANDTNEMRWPTGPNDARAADTKRGYRFLEIQKIRRALTDVATRAALEKTQQLVSGTPRWMPIDLDWAEKMCRKPEFAKDWHTQALKWANTTFKQLGGAGMEAKLWKASMDEALNAAYFAPSGGAKKCKSWTSDGKKCMYYFLPKKPPTEGDCWNAVLSHRNDIERLVDKAREMASARNITMSGLSAHNSTLVYGMSGLDGVGLGASNLPKAIPAGQRPLGQGVAPVSTGTTVAVVVGGMALVGFAYWVWSSRK